MIRTKKDYKELLDKELSFNYDLGIRATDLFSGCGGLSMGFESAGIITTGYESNTNAVSSYNRNLKGKAFCHELDLNSHYEQCDILIAGPPCQPYSAAGKKMGSLDKRNGFPIIFDALKKINPKVVVIENVKGLIKQESYLKSILRKLRKLEFKCNISVLNSKHFLVPQNRERLFIVGVKGPKKFSFPKNNDIVINSGNALGFIRSSIPKGTKILTSNIDRYILKYEIASKCKRPRDLHLDIPSRTITCRNLSGSTGDMMRIRLNNGKRRTLSIREAATLQSFPNWFKFSGSNQEIFNQIGNAVPPLLGKAIAKELVNQFFS